MRILHTSDWHLGRQFHNCSLLDDQRHILGQIVELVRSQRVEVVLISGDIYDRSVPPASAVALLDEVLTQLCRDLKVTVILIAGNHDGAERLAFGARQLAGARLHIVGPLNAELAPVVVRDAHGEVAFYPLPYAEPATVREVFGEEVADHDGAMALLTARLRAGHDPARRSVVLAHCFLTGGEASESERPLALGGAEQVAARHFDGFDYVALGHLHGRQSKERPTLRYSGSPLKYSFGEERQSKSVTLVELASDGSCAIEQLPLAPLRDLRIIEGGLSELLVAGQTDPRRDDYLLVRLTDTHALLDVMNQLRSVYPNVLHLERPGLLGRGETLATSRERLHRGEEAMFRDFYQQVTGQELSAEQAAFVDSALATLRKGEG